MFEEPYTPGGAVSGPPDIASLRRGIERTRREIAALAESIWRVDSGELGPLLVQVAALRDAVDSAAVVIAEQAHMRGVVAESTCAHARQWVSAHDGGLTSVANSALLCERHHTVVHRDRLTATVDDQGVRWGLIAAAA